MGHAKSPYYTNKHEELKRIYKEGCMKYLTFLDYPTIEATGRSFEAKLKEKDKEIAALTQKVSSLEEKLSMSRDNMTNGLGEMVKQLRQDNEKMMQRIAELEKKNNSATANSSS